jgi:aryl-alcohol dehydrogenase-like predicted oxidoreductase
MTTSMISLGKTGPRLFPIGLGCMGMSGVYGQTEERRSIATIHAALERGINLIDTGDFYGAGHNELLIGRAIKDRRDRAVLSVKFGALRTPQGAFGGVDTRPASIRNFLTYTLTRLGVDHVDIYRPARLDPGVPIEDTVGAIADLIKAGYVRHVGLSEVGVETIRRAQAVHPICDLQIEYSLISRGPEEKIFPLLAELGIAATVYGVLSRGLLTGARPAAGDFRAQLPRFSPENLAANQKLVDALAALARQKGVGPAELAIAWSRSRYPFVVPVMGARSPAQLEEALASLAVTLTPAEVSTLEAAVPADQVAGKRYQPAQMQALDSER